VPVTLMLVPAAARSLPMPVVWPGWCVPAAVMGEAITWKPAAGLQDRKSPRTTAARCRRCLRRPTPGHPRELWRCDLHARCSARRSRLRFAFPDRKFPTRRRGTRRRRVTPVIRCGHRRVRWRCDRCAEWRSYRAARPGRNARRSPTSRSPVARLRRGARERVRGSC
jgi:hypothetical protein